MTPVNRCGCVVWRYPPRGVLPRSDYQHFPPPSPRVESRAGQAAPYGTVAFKPLRDGPPAAPSPCVTHREQQWHHTDERLSGNAGMAAPDEWPRSHPG